MNKKNINPLLGKYYQGDTSLEQEAELREEVIQGEDLFPEEKVIFEYYRDEGKAPNNLEELIFDQIVEKNTQTKLIQNNWFRYASIAAAICLAISIFWFNHVRQKPVVLSEDEQFAILEQALYNISTSVKPAENQDLLVLFQDENLEIVMD